MPRSPKKVGQKRKGIPPVTKPEGSVDSIRAAEDMALAAFGSGLRLAAALGTVVAKTASIALASMASSADKFGELVKNEALQSKKPRKRRLRENRLTNIGSGQSRRQRRMSSRKNSRNP